MTIGNKLKHRDIKSFSIEKSTLQKILNVLMEENRKAQSLEIKHEVNNNNYEKLSLSSISGH